MPRHLRGTTLCHDFYLPFLAEIDKRVGRKARVELQAHFDFLDAWTANLTPEGSVAAGARGLRIRHGGRPCVKSPKTRPTQERMKLCPR
jgi:hypothetical protein